MFGKFYDLLNEFFELIQKFFVATIKGRTVIKLLIVLAIVIPCFFKLGFFASSEKSGKLDHDSILLVKTVNDHVTSGVHSVGEGFKNTGKGLSEVFSGLVIAFSHTFRIISPDSKDVAKAGAKDKANESACCEISGFKKGHDAYYLLGWFSGAGSLIFSVWFTTLLLQFRS